MEGQQYLDQISELNKPTKPVGSKGGFNLRNILTSKFFIVGAIGLGVLIVLIIIGAILGGGKDSEKTLCYRLELHLSKTVEVIQEYQNNIRSSTLRSSSASLQGVLANTDNKLVTYLEGKYNFKSKDIDKKIETEALTAQDELNNELFEAKINGILDRIFAHRMAYEISLFTTEEAKLINSTNDNDLKSLLEESYSSLENLIPNFEDFSETRN